MSDANKNEITDKDFGKKYPKALLDLLIEVSEDGKVLSDEDIQEEVDTFTFAVSKKTIIQVAISK